MFWDLAGTLIPYDNVTGRPGPLPGCGDFLPELARDFRLVVTTGERRLKNMLRQARRAKAAGLFYFTTYDQISPATLLESPIWRRADRDEPMPLIKQCYSLSENSG